MPDVNVAGPATVSPEDRFTLTADSARSVGARLQSMVCCDSALYSCIGAACMAED